MYHWNNFGLYCVCSCTWFNMKRNQTVQTKTTLHLVLQLSRCLVDLVVVFRQCSILKRMTHKYAIHASDNSKRYMVHLSMCAFQTRYQDYSCFNKNVLGRLVQTYQEVTTVLLCLHALHSHTHTHTQLRDSSHIHRLLTHTHTHTHTLTDSSHTHTLTHSHTLTHTHTHTHTHTNTHTRAQTPQHWEVSLLFFLCCVLHTPTALPI